MERYDWSTALTRSSARVADVAAVLPHRPQATIELEARMRELSRDLAGFGGAVAEGLYEDVIAETPRLGPVVRRLSAKQSELQREVDEHLARLCPDTAPAMSRSLIHLCRKVDSAASRAVQLVYDSVDVDLGGPGD